MSEEPENPGQSEHQPEVPPPSTPAPTEPLPSAQDIINIAQMETLAKGSLAESTRMAERPLPAQLGQNEE